MIEPIGFVVAVLVLCINVYLVFVVLDRARGTVALALVGLHSTLGLIAALLALYWMGA